MKTKQFYFGMLIALVAMAFSACSSDDALNEQGTELKLSAGITAQKEPYNINEWGTKETGDIDACYSKESKFRAPTTRTPINNSDWKDMSNRNMSVQVGNNNPTKCTIDASGNIMFPTPYYFISSSDIYVMAWYPYSSSKLSSFSVKTDQTTYANYEASDLLYASKIMNPSEPSANLSFSHKTAKILVYVTINNSHYLYDPRINDVTLSNLYTSGNISNGTLTKSGVIGSVKMYNSVVSFTSSSDITTATFEACVIPQTTALSYSITYGSGIYTGSISSKELKSGNVYTISINLTVGQLVDLGLSVKWSRLNIGASSAASYGSYYEWGATQEYNASKWNSSGTTSAVAWSASTPWGYWNSDTDITPSGGHDIARIKWGNPWRMPTKDELQELIDQCNWTWTVLDGNRGYLLKNKNGTNKNSLFLSNSGYMLNGESRFSVNEGDYWSSTTDVGNSYFLFFHTTNDPVVSLPGGKRPSGFNVRPVQNK